MYWVRAAALLEHGTLYGPNFHVHPMNAHRGIDIDTMEDWDFAELIVRGLQARDGFLPLEQPAQPIAMVERQSDLSLTVSS